MIIQNVQKRTYAEAMPIIQIFMLQNEANSCIDYLFIGRSSIYIFVIPDLPLQSEKLDWKEQGSDVPNKSSGWTSEKYLEDP